MSPGRCDDLQRCGPGWRRSFNRQSRAAFGEVVLQRSEGAAPLFFISLVCASVASSLPLKSDDTDLTLASLQIPGKLDTRDSVLCLSHDERLLACPELRHFGVY